ncbi:MAG: TIGR03960 family B12-binding radical SAM protein [Chloroflexota bacterium]
MDTAKPYNSYLMSDKLTDLDRILHQVAKPARYTGGEWNAVIKDWDKTSLRFALAYPDLYEIGMSNMALPILYRIINSRESALAERVFTPWGDMASRMRDAGIPLCSLESRRPLKEFDVIGFSLSYELTYTNVLTMLDLAQIPVLAAERDGSYPLVIAGGTCSLNPEPMSDFIDFFVLGDGEDVLVELLDFLDEEKKRGTDKHELLRRVAAIPGIYVPALYRVAYDEDGLFCSITPEAAGATLPVRRRIVMRLPPPVTSPVVPYIEAVHDRGALEIQRGCSRGCRFCQATMVYRPIRERSQDEIVRAVGDIIEGCGYHEISLVSLSTSDYPDIYELAKALKQRYQSRNLSLQLPSLRIDNFSVELMELLSKGRRTGLTFAPEAGSERLRRVINKPIAGDDILRTAEAAFRRGWMGIKLYFMLGLPTEDDDDIEGIIQMINTIRVIGSQDKGRRPNLRISLSTFIPKPHTPFQWVAQASEDAISRKQERISREVSRKGIRLSWSDPKTSLLEAALSRGDRRLGRVIHLAWQGGAVFDAWSEHFKYEIWEKAFAAAGLEPAFYALRERSLDEALPWGHIDTGISPDFLKGEYRKALTGSLTPDCRNASCNHCGLEKLACEVANNKPPRG